MDTQIELQYIHACTKEMKSTYTHMGADRDTLREKHTLTYKHTHIERQRERGKYTHTGPYTY